VAEVFVENCDNDFLIDDVKAYKPADHAQALKLVMDRLGSAGFLQSEGLRSVVASRPPRDSRQESRNEWRGQDPALRLAFTPAQHKQHSASEQQDRPPRPAVASGGHAEGGAVRRQPSKVKCTRCRREGHTIDSCICKHDADGNRLDKADDATYAARRARAEELKKLNVNAVQSESSATEDLSSVHDTTDEEVCALFALSDSDSDYEDHADVDEIDDDVFRFWAQHTLQCCIEHTESLLEYYNRNVPAPPLLDCGDIEANPGPSHPAKPMKRMEIAACVLATCPVLANKAAAAVPLHDWVQCKAFIPPSLTLFILSSTIICLVGKFLWTTTAAYLEQQHTLEHVPQTRSGSIKFCKLYAELFIASLLLGHASASTATVHHTRQPTTTFDLLLFAAGALQSVWWLRKVLLYFVFTFKFPSFLRSLSPCFNVSEGHLEGTPHLRVRQISGHSAATPHAVPGGGYISTRM
jgi:hypothetical protein